MKVRLYISFSLFSLLLMTACEREIEVRPINFEVTGIPKKGASVTEYNLGDSVGFAFTGNPDLITFYSGKIGNRYEYRDRSEADGKAVLSFKTVLDNKNVNQPSTLSLLVSDDFKGIVNRTAWSIVTRDTIATTANVGVATWTDITGRAVLSSTNGSSVASGNIDLSDFTAKNKPVFIAFKYKADAGQLQPGWTITDFLVKNVLPDNTEYTLANLQISATPFYNYGAASYNPGWGLVNDRALSADVAFTHTAATRLQVTGIQSNTANRSEVWAVIGPINLKKVSPDNGVAIKSINNRLEQYYIPKADNYLAPGDYKAIFVASNQTVDQSAGTIKQIDVRIK